MVVEPHRSGKRHCRPADDVQHASWRQQFEHRLDIGLGAGSRERRDGSEQRARPILRTRRGVLGKQREPSSRHDGEVESHASSSILSHDPRIAVRASTGGSLRRMPRRSLVVALILYLALRLWLATTPGYAPDLGQFKLWALQSQQDGLASLYAGGADHDFSRFDYPPFYAYVLRAIGWVYSFVEPDALRRQADSTLLTVLVKLPALIGDLAVALLFAAIARRAARRSASGANAPASGAAMVAAAWLLNPAVLLDCGHWGQPDSIHSGFVLAAFATLAGAIGPPRGSRQSVVLAWVLLALAALMKPLGAPFFPLLLAASLLVGGVAATLVGGVAALATAALLFAPFVAEWGVADVAQRILGDVTIMSYTSVNAHNLWWLAGPWRDSDAAGFWSLTATQVGIALFLAMSATLIVLLVRRHRQRRAGVHAAQLLALGALLATAFFLLSTHMHENHLFGALPLLLGAVAAAPAGNGARRTAWILFASVAFGVAWNIAAHDLEWRQHWPLSIGADQPYIADAVAARLPRGEYLAGTCGAWWNLAAGAALAAFVFGRGLVRLAWETTPPAPDDSERGRGG